MARDVRNVQRRERFLPVWKPSPAMPRSMRQAHLYGRLIEREGMLYAPGGCWTSPVCRKDFAARMVNRGWLAAHGKNYRLTETGKLFVAEAGVTLAIPGRAASMNCT
jgi:hypothetical protein